MYRHVCPKCHAVYYSAAMMSGFTVPWICGICRQVMVTEGCQAPVVTRWDQASKPQNSETPGRRGGRHS